MGISVRNTLMPAASPAIKSRPSWVIIVNPASANGRTGRDWLHNQSLLEGLLPKFEAWLTEYPGHARLLAQKARDLGFSTIAVHGGDGTINEVVNGLLCSSQGDPTLALFPSGTGADLVRTLGIPHPLKKAVGPALKGSSQRIDVGLVQFEDLQGHPSQRYFINVTDVGFGGDLVRFVNSHSKKLGGKLSFFRGLLVTLFRYKNRTIRITLDNKAPFQVRASSIVVANGQYFGGGMWVAPPARLDDGILDVVAVGDVSKREVLTNIPRLYRGTLAAHPKVRTYQARQLELTSKEEVLIDLDGELVGRLPASFQILSQKIKILC